VIASKPRTTMNKNLTYQPSGAAHFHSFGVYSLRGYFVTGGILLLNPVLNKTQSARGFLIFVRIAKTNATDVANSWFIIHHAMPSYN
jgi:hypothetical protein